MVQLNCRLAPHWSQTTFVLFWLHCRILSWYSSIAAGLPTGHKTTPQYNLPPFDTPYIHFLFILLIYSPAIRYCYNGTAGLGSPPVKRQPPISGTPFLHSLYPISLHLLIVTPSLHSLFMKMKREAEKTTKSKWELTFRTPCIMVQLNCFLACPILTPTSF